jgi:rfaE bifunctional protein nucleotidyltransferase chain/domain/rfaE bifunctional protein kinase chain/domain
MTRRPLVVVGDALLDRDVEGAVERLSPDAPVPVVDEATTHARPGGAALAAALAATSGRPVTLVTALARDTAGAELAALVVDRGIEVVDLGLDGVTPEKVRITTDARPLLRLDRGGGGAVGAPGAAARAAIGWAGAVLVADYGRGVAAGPELRAALRALGPDVPLVWDPHPNGPAPVPGVRLATPNLAEATAIVPEPPGDALPAVAARARALAARWRADAVCITCGARGAVLAAGDGTPLAVPAEPVPGGDPCGAGDRFASAAAEALADGATAAAAVERAVATASSFVAAGGAGAVARELASAAPRADGEGGLALARRVGAAGGTVVATGGCFDLLHSGHVRTLEAARALGDCLVVLLNSDASVRTIKGAGRPVVGQDDRARVLAALRCVDAVVVFDEPTPEAALARVRPHVWAKGADYAGRELPEAKVLAEWGGEVVLLPLVDGQSTTRLIEEATLRAVR